jgi:hypothetical protein
MTHELLYSIPFLDADHGFFKRFCKVNIVGVCQFHKVIQNISKVIFNSCDGFFSLYALSCSSIGQVEFCVNYVSRQFSRLFAQMSKDVKVVVYSRPFLPPFLKKPINIFLSLS